MVLKKKSTLLIMTFLIGLFVYAYGKENSITGESHLKNIEEVYSTEETKFAEEEVVAQWEKGYELPVDEHEE